MAFAKSFVQRGSFKTCVAQLIAGGDCAEKFAKIPRTSFDHRFLPAASTPHLAQLRRGAGSRPSGADGALPGLQHSRANSALAVSATNPNIKWHITFLAPRT